MEKYGKDIDSKDKWNEMAEGYSNQLVNEYHDHRLAVINSLIPDDIYHAGKSIFDFGCGDALHFEQFARKGCRITGCDVSIEMIALAKQRLSKMSLSPDVVSIGGVRELADLESNSLDGILSFNVLAYLTDEEEDLFYKQAFRLIRPGGYLIVTHSNELFDMYSMNLYTAEFLSRYLVTDDRLRALLPTLFTNSAGTEKISTYNVRENPLTYRFKLDRHGFIETRQEFINLHSAPPPLLGKDKSYPSTLSWREEDRWKLMFICSTYGSLSIRKPSIS